MAAIFSVIRRNRVLTVIVSGILAAIILGSVTLLTLRLRLNNHFSLGIERLEVYAEEGKRTEAAAMYLALIPSASTPQQFIRLFEAGYQLHSQGIIGFEALSGVAQRSMRKFGGNQTLRALSTDYYIRAGDYTDAANLAEDLTAERFASIAVEALLLDGRSVESRDNLLRGLAVPFLPQDSADPQKHLEAGLLTGDRRYFIDAALLMAADGRITEAFDILYGRREIFRNSADAEVLLRMAWDTGDTESMIELSSFLPPIIGLDERVLFRMSDGFFYEGMANRSFEILGTIAERHAILEEEAQENRLALILSHGYPAMNLDAVQEGIRNSTGISPVLHLSENRSQSGAVADGFEQALRYYREIYPDNSGLKLVEIVYPIIHRREEGQNSRVNLEDIRSAIVVQAESGSNSDAIKLYAYLLFLDDDRTELRRFVRQNVGTLEASADLYLGYIDAVERQYNSAVEHFSRAGGSYAWYNAGLILMYQRQFTAALEAFEVAQATLYKENGATGRVMTREKTFHDDIRVYRAFAAALSGKDSQAQSILQDLDAERIHHSLIPTLRNLLADADNP